MSISLQPDTPQERTLAPPPVAFAAPGVGPFRAKMRNRLFTKYVGLFVAVVGVALLSNGIFEVFFYYREHKAALIRIQHEQAEAAAAKIGQFIKEIESQLGWTTQLPWPAGSIEQRRFDALRLLQQVPAITELAWVDSTGKERLRVSRLAMDVVDSGLNLSQDPKFAEAVAHKVYYGPVYFRRESEPYMTLSLAGTAEEAGVSIADVNLKLIWDVVSNIKVGERGHAYVVGPQGRLIAHPDISLVLRNTDMSRLIQVQAAQGAGTDLELVQGALNIRGQEVLTASAPIAPLGWTMFVELPAEEAYAPLYLALQRLAVVLAGASIFAVLAGIFLARRMVGPIQALRAGAECIGGGDFAQRISIKTGDELEGLANQFNDMGARLQESYANLEDKVEQRTRELSLSLENLRSAQDRIVQTEKLASLGQLTAGIAHEINSPVGTSLTIASSLAQRCLAFVNELASGQLRRSQLSAFVESNRNAANQLVTNLEHAAELVQSFKQVAVNQVREDRHLFDLNRATNQMLAVLTPTLKGSDIVIEIDVPDGIMMNSYPGPYGQVLTKLFFNAVTHGFGERRCGRITIKAQRQNTDQVEIIFTDDGKGMSDAVRRQAFDPFFTTDHRGGMGLGLHIVYNIVT